MISRVGHVRGAGVVGLVLVLAASVSLSLGAGSAWALPHLFSSSFGSQGTGAGQVSSPEGVAVNAATGNVYVADTGNARIDEFDSNGEFVRAWGWGVADGAPGFETCTLACQAGTSGSGAGQFKTAKFIAIDNSTGPSAGDVYVGDPGDDLVTKFDANGDLLSSWGAGGQLNGSAATGGPFTALAGITVDPAGDLFAYDPIPGNWFEFAQDGTPAPTVTVERTTQNIGIGVDGSGNFYKAVGFGGIEQFSSSGGDLGEVTPRVEVTGFAIDPVSSDVYAAEGTTILHYEGAGLPACVPSSSCQAVDTFGSGDLSGATGLAFDPATKAVYAADTGDQRIDMFLPPAPAVDSATVANLTASSGDLTARINPNGYDTTYRFEWGTNTSYGTAVPVPDADIGAGGSDVEVSRHLTGLVANTVYHWRVVATSQRGTTTSHDHTFVYDTTAGQSLPDGRAYEQVTPVQKNAALVESTGTNPLDIAANGSRVIFSSNQCFGSVGSCSIRNGNIGEPFVAERAAAGWVTTPMAPPARMGNNTAVFFSADADTALFSISTPPAGEDDYYAREPDGSFVDIGPISSPARGPIGTASGLRNETFATADLSHVAFMGQPAFLGWPFDSSTGFSSIYEYSGAGNTQPVLVGVNGGLGSTELLTKCSTFASGPGRQSSDGRTIYFEATGRESGCAGGVLPADEIGVRIDGTLPDARTVMISQRSPADCTTSACLSSTPRDAQFLAASSDGTKAIFTSRQQLTDEASQDNTETEFRGCERTTGVGGCNLYLYDFANAAGHELVDVSAGDTSGGGPRVQGVVAFSGDGSHVYFVAKGVLASAANAQGQSAQDGAENLYVYERDAAHPAGQTSFIGALSETDVLLLTSVANVTPDGRYLVFTTSQPLMADAPNASGTAQVYRYDSQTGELARISVGENGFNDNGNTGSGNATIVPAHDFVGRAGPARLDPTMSDDGSYVFFQSPIALTPHALNDVVTDSAGDLAQNVYEWHDGRVYLISDGRDSGPGLSFCYADRRSEGSSVCLLGTDAAGANVFFTTADQLVPQDTDTGLDIYDARIDGGFPYTPSQSCRGDGCQGVQGTSPAPPGAASATFSGPGNLATPAVVSHGKPTARKHVKRKKRRRLAPKRRARRATRGSHGHGGGHR